MFFEATPVTPETLLAEVRRLADAEYRFVTMSQTCWMSILCACTIILTKT